jgi:DNA topoisomerase I
MAVRLRRSKPDGPGWTRRRRGSGFSYLDADGNVITDPEICERIRSLVIPPAWRDVWICPYPNGHVQAVGVDDAGRRQYLYHDAWRQSRDAAKHDRVRRLARRLPDFRLKIHEDLQSPGITKERVLATALRMLDHGVFRTGNDEYAEEYGSRGAATLLREDVTVKGGRLVFEFTAKGGQERFAVLEDSELAKALTALRRCRTGSERLLVYRDTDGWREISAGDVNERFRELVGDGFTVKDLRTWHATLLAAVILAGTEPPRSKRAASSAVRSMIAEVADHLGNTPSVARRSYIDPKVIEQFEKGHTIERALRRTGSDDLTDPTVRATLERSLTRLLAS